MLRLSKLIPDGVENGFSILGKAAKNQHRLGCDCVDHITNLLVVKKQINELSDLDVVDRDNWLAIRSYGEILLVCLIVHFYIPHRTAINADSGQRRTANIRLN